MQLNLSWSEDERTRAGIATIDDYRYVIRQLVPDEYETYFQEQSRYINAHTSTAIEGNPLGHQAAMQVLIEGANQDEPAEIEKVNLDEAYQFIGQLASDKTTKIDEGLIRALNSGTLRGLPDEIARNRGRYRVSQNLIVDPQTREVRYRPPAPELVSELMAYYVECIGRWRREFPGPVAAALAHFGLVSIHPFDDGNGRTARLVADLVLGLTGWSVEGLLSANQELLDRRDEYYRVLRQTQGERFAEAIDVSPFVAFHTDCLGVSTMRLHSRVVSFLRRRDKLLEELSFLNSRQGSALMFMWDIGPLSSSRLARLTKTSAPTALSDLGQLVSNGVVVKVGAGPKTRYRFNPSVLPQPDAGDR